MIKFLVTTNLSDLPEGPIIMGVQMDFAQKPIKRPPHLLYRGSGR